MKNTIADMMVGISDLSHEKKIKRIKLINRKAIKKITLSGNKNSDTLAGKMPFTINMY